MVTAVSKMASQNFELDFEPGLTDQFRTLKQCVAATVYGYRRGGLSAVAASLDVSPSLLSRRLNENEDDPRHFPLDDLAGVMATTHDYRPVYWLMEKFLRSKVSREDQILSEAEELISGLNALLPKLRNQVQSK